MSQLRDVQIEPASDWTASGTKPFNLDFTQPLTEIQIYAVFTAGTTTWAASPAANITKVELKDGGRTLWSSTGMATQGHNMRTTGQSPVGYQHLRNTKGVGVAINLGFGRFVGDRKYAFDPSTFENPNLEVSWNEAVHNTSCTVNSIYIKGTVFADNAPKPPTFLRLYEVKNWSPTASQDEPVKMPRNNVVRSVYYQALKSQTSQATTVGNIKLDENSGGNVPYDDDAYKISRTVNTSQPLFHEDYRIHVATSGDTYFSAIGNIIGGTTGSYDSASASGFASHMGGSFKMRVENGSQYYTAHLTGYDPQGMYLLPTGDMQDDTTWLNAKALDAWKLTVTAGAAAASTDTFRAYVEEVYPNGPKK